MNALAETSKIWAEIDLDALRHNYRRLKEQAKAASPEAEVIAVVKANAYGHGVEPVSRALLGEGCRYFAVSCTGEAAVLRQTVGQEPRILILGYSLPEEAELLCSLQVIQTVYSEEYARALSDRLNTLVQKGRLPADTALPVHLKLDTGMNRLGFDTADPKAASDVLARVMTLPYLSFEGMFTHFATADTDAGDRGNTARQMDRFSAVSEILKKRGICPPFLHTCNSAAAVTLSRGVLSGIRAGDLLYGMSPFGCLLPDYRPVMTLKARIAHIHTLKAGDSVSYGAVFTADRDMRIATVPVGYGDGFCRHFGSASLRLPDGTDAPIVGRICMDQCMIALEDADVHPGDAVTVFGGDDGSLLEALAAAGHTINYEITTLLTPRVPRILKETK